MCCNSHQSFANIDECRFKIYINDVFLCRHQSREIAESIVKRILSQYYILNCDIYEIQINKEIDSPFIRRWFIKRRLYNTLSNIFEPICKIDIRNVSHRRNRRNNSSARVLAS